jgi:hypothetical protein
LWQIPILKYLPEIPMRIFNAFLDFLTRFIECPSRLNISPRRIDNLVYKSPVSGSGDSEHQVIFVLRRVSRFWSRFEA